MERKPPRPVQFVPPSAEAVAALDALNRVPSWICTNRDLSLNETGEAVAAAIRALVTPPRIQGS